MPEGSRVGGFPVMEPVEQSTRGEKGRGGRGEGGRGNGG